MSYLNVQINHNEEDISNILISYERSIQICTGIGMLSVVFVDNGRSFEPWDILTIYEIGIKRGEFYISSIVKNIKDGTISLEAQDGSKKLVDYFISDTYKLTEPSKTSDWISFFLNKIGMSYNIIGGSGVQMSENTELGLSSAYDTIIQLLQYSGWFMFLNSNGTCIIGALDKGIGSAKTFDDSVITSIKLIRHDRMLRNKAVVWGAYDSETNTWVYVNKTRSTEWDYDAKDKRAIVFSNHYIKNNSTAEDISNKLLNEFARLNFEKEIEIVGSPEVTLGTFTKINSKFFSTNGIITSIVTRFGSSGLVTTLILDERCPRLFGFWSDVIEDDDDFRYVYSGLWGGGVYRKRLSESTWESYNTGLTNLYVKDLYVNNGILAIVLNDGKAYYRTIEDASWTEIVPTSFIDNDSITYSAQAECCTIDDNGNIIIIYNNFNDYLGWIVVYNIYSGVTRNDLITIIYTEEGEETIQDFVGYNIDNKNDISIIGGARIAIEEKDIVLPNEEYPNFGTRINTFPITHYKGNNMETTALTGFPQVNLNGSVGIINVPKTYFYLPNTAGNIITILNNGVGEVTGLYNISTATPKFLKVFFDIKNGIRDSYIHDLNFSINIESAFLLKNVNNYYVVVNLQQVAKIIPRVSTSIYNITSPYDRSKSLLFGGSGNSGNGSSTTSFIGFYEWYNYYEDGYSNITYCEIDFPYTSNIRTNIYTISSENSSRLYETSYVTTDAVYADVYLLYNLTSIRAISWKNGESISEVLYEIPGVESLEDLKFTGLSFTRDFTLETNGSYVKRYTGMRLRFTHIVESEEIAIYFYVGIESINGELSIDFGDKPERFYNLFLISTKDHVHNINSKIFGNVFAARNPLMEDINELYIYDTEDFSLLTTIEHNQEITDFASNGDDFVSVIYIADATGYIASYTLDGELINTYTGMGGAYIDFFDATGAFMVGGGRISGGVSSKIVLLKGGYGTTPTDVPYYSVIKDENSEFEFLLDTDTKSHVDLSVSRPLGVYTELQQEDEEHEFIQSCLYSNFTYLENDFNELADGKKFPITDIRVYNDFQDTTISGNQRIGAIAGGSLRTIDTKLMEEWTELFVPSGTAYKLETSTYSYDPYIFVSTYNNTGSTFYQKNSGSSTFINQSLGLPDKNINIIRVDDRI